jgi:hypothetical protein
MAIIRKTFNKTLTRFALNTANAAHFIGVSEALLRKMRAEGNGPSYATVNKKIVYPVPELKKFLEKHLVTGGAQNEKL